MQKARQRYGEKLLLLPAVIVVAVCTQIPFVVNIFFAFLNWNLNRPDLGRSFAGVKNFIYFLKDVSFWKDVLQTAELVAASIVLCMIIGYFLALLLDRKMPGINIARALIITPYFLMTTASGVVWKFTMFNSNFGWFGKIGRMFTPVLRAPLALSP